MATQSNSQDVARQLDALASDYDWLCGPGWRTDPAVVIGFVQAAKNAVLAGCSTIPAESGPMQVVQNAEQEQNALAVQQSSVS